MVHLTREIICRWMGGMIDEGPSAEDLQRFSDDTGRCPACGAEIWDQAERCPACGEYIAETRTIDPGRARGRRRWALVVTIITLLAFVLWMVL